jgi:WD40 repeat protein
MEKVADAISLTGHTDVVSSVAWNVQHKAQLTATACKDKRLRVYDPRASPKPIQVLFFLFFILFLSLLFSSVLFYHSLSFSLPTLTLITLLL